MREQGGGWARSICGYPCGLATDSRTGLLVLPTASIAVCCMLSIHEVCIFYTTVYDRASPPQWWVLQFVRTTYDGKKFRRRNRAYIVVFIFRSACE